MSDLIPVYQLIEYFDNETFVLNTQRQISKDFAKFNLFFPENFESTPYSKLDIETMIKQNVQDLIREGETRLLQLMYTIDLPEKEFLHLTVQNDFLELLADKILRREAYKVFLRQHFK
ncbi:MAG: hypothetical protein EP305_12745 [Bacteroidetes bacterium]|nr:MAG: hypothetical protein EP305_12745 [Bacteroidota bacterium]